MTIWILIAVVWSLALAIHRIEPGKKKPDLTWRIVVEVDGTVVRQATGIGTKDYQAKYKELLGWLKATYGPLGFCRIKPRRRNIYIYRYRLKQPGGMAIIRVTKPSSVPVAV